MKFALLLTMFLQLTPAERLELVRETLREIDACDATTLAVLNRTDRPQFGTDAARDTETGASAIQSPPTKPASSLPGVLRGYPVRGSLWTHPGPSSKANLVAHLSGSEHRGKFDYGWLSSLTVTELESLHSDDHEGRVNWRYAKRPAQQVQKQPLLAAPQGRWVMQKFCNGRQCWTQMVWVAA